MDSTSQATVFDMSHLQTHPPKPQRPVSVALCLSASGVRNRFSRTPVGNVNRLVTAGKVLPRGGFRCHRRARWRPVMEK